MGGIAHKLYDRYLQSRKDRDALNIDGKKIVIEGQKVEVERDKLQDASNAALRDDLLSRLHVIETRLDAVQADADQWRSRYWSEVESHTATRIQNTQLAAQVKQLQDEYATLSRRYETMAAQLSSLQETVGYQPETGA